MFEVVLVNWVVQIQAELPIVVSTWAFVDAVRAAARHVINHGGSAVDAVVHGCSACEVLQCDGSGTLCYKSIRIWLVVICEMWL